MPSRNIVEEDAIKKIESLLPTRYCESFIKKASTEASFDGYVNLFKDRNLSQKEGMFQIPIQSKGTTTDLTNEKGSISVGDLKNYIGQGICYFITYINYDNNESISDFKIYARCLIPLDINTYLSRIVDNQKKITFKFKRMKNEDDMLKLFRAFELKIRTVNLNSNINFDAPIEGEFTFVNEDNEISNIPKLGETYFVKVENGSKQTFLHNLKITDEVIPLNGPVSVKGNVFFDYIERRQNTKNGFYLDFNSSLSLKMEEGKFLICLNKNSDFESFLKATYFLKSAFENKEFSIGNYSIPLLNDKQSLDNLINYYDSLFVFSLAIKKLFESIGYKKNFSLMDLDKNSINNVGFLYSIKSSKSINYYLLKTTLFKKMVVKVTSNDISIYLSVFDLNLYSVVKFKRNNDSEITSTLFIYFTQSDWEEMELDDLTVFSKIIMRNVTFCEENKNDYLIVAKRIMDAYNVTQNEKLKEYAEFLIDYFKLSMN